MTQTSHEHAASSAKNKPDHVTVKINNKPVKLEPTTLTGLEIKRQATAQDVGIEEDFLLTLEASKDHPARTIGDDQPITVEKHDEFTANDGDDDS